MKTSHIRFVACLYGRTGSFIALIRRGWLSESSGSNTGVGEPAKNAFAAASPFRAMNRENIGRKPDATAVP
jgi:hypothetical protein